MIDLPRMDKLHEPMKPAEMMLCSVCGYAGSEDSHPRCQGEDGCRCYVDSRGKHFCQGDGSGLCDRCAWELPRIAAKRKERWAA